MPQEILPLSLWFLLPPRRVVPPFFSRPQFKHCRNFFSGTGCSRHLCDEVEEVLPLAAGDILFGGEIALGLLFFSVPFFCGRSRPPRGRSARCPTTQPSTFFFFPPCFSLFRARLSNGLAPFFRQQHSGGPSPRRKFGEFFFFPF